MYSSTDVPGITPSGPAGLCCRSMWISGRIMLMSRFVLSERLK